jgi:hypothetical protein
VSKYERLYEKTFRLRVESGRFSWGRSETQSRTIVVLYYSPQPLEERSRAWGTRHIKKRNSDAVIRYAHASSITSHVGYDISMVTIFFKPLTVQPGTGDAATSSVKPGLGSILQVLILQRLLLLGSGLRYT